jgi:hypothetical protein
MGKITSLLEQHSIFCLNSPSEDDLYKIYYIKSQHLTNKWYRVIASFGATSCSCYDQTKNPYQSCSHMKRLDKILKYSPEFIQTLN